jgi:hypothetical protein
MNRKFSAVIMLATMFFASAQTASAQAEVEWPQIITEAYKLGLKSEYVIPLNGSCFYGLKGPVSLLQATKSAANVAGVFYAEMLTADGDLQSITLKYPGQCPSGPPPLPAETRAPARVPVVNMPETSPTSNAWVVVGFVLLFVVLLGLFGRFAH